MLAMNTDRTFNIDRNGRLPWMTWLCLPLLFFCLTQAEGCVGTTASRTTGRVSLEVLDHANNDATYQAPEVVPQVDPSAPREFDIDRWLPESEKGVMYSFVDLLAQKRRSRTMGVLDRAAAYLPAIIASLGEQGVPRELAALPFIESAFQYDALSHAGAAGLWQLMPHTARRFGLVVNDQVDERYDVHKASKAAAKYLSFLHNHYGEWPLALAAYNCGERRMDNALLQSGTKTLAELTQFCRTTSEQKILREETLQFVPRFTAAVYIMSKSKELGLTAENLLNVNAYRASETNNFSERDNIPDVPAP